MASLQIHDLLRGYLGGADFRTPEQAWKVQMRSNLSVAPAGFPSYAIKSVPTSSFFRARTHHLIICRIAYEDATALKELSRLSSKRTFFCSGRGGFRVVNAPRDSLKDPCF
jgi:hypothetical protein